LALMETKGIVRTTIAIVIGTALSVILISNHPPKSKAAEEVCGSNAKVANLNFTVKDIDGNDVALNAFKGNVILLNFWATWCPPCRKEIPEFIGLYNTYKPQGFVVLGVSVDDSLPAVKKFTTQFKVNYPVLIGRGRTDLQKAFAPIPGYPTTMIISRDGRICFQHTGFTPLEQFEEKIKALL
jgi:peroxiredoxin